MSNVVNQTTLTVPTGLGMAVNLIATFKETNYNIVTRVSTIQVTFTLNHHGGSGVSSYQNSNGHLHCYIGQGSNQLDAGFNGDTVNFKLGVNVSKSVGTKTFTWQHTGNDDTPPSIQVQATTNYPNGSSLQTVTGNLTLTALPKAPGAVTGLTVTPGSPVTVSNNQVWPLTLKWTDPTTGGAVKTFNVYRGTDPSSLQLVAAVTQTKAGVTTYVDRSVAVQPVSTYSTDMPGYGPIYFRVDATNSGGAGKGTVETGYLPSPPVDQATIVTNSSGQPVISWVTTSPYSDDTAITYKVTRYVLAEVTSGSTAGDWEFKVDATYNVAHADLGQTITYTDTVAGTGSLYKYGIEVVDGAGEGRGSLQPTYAVISGTSYNLVSLGSTPPPPTISIQQQPNPSVISTGVSRLTLQASSGTKTVSWSYKGVPNNLTGYAIAPISFTAQYSLDNASWSSLPLANVTPGATSTLSQPVVTADIDLSTLASAGNTVWLRFAAVAAAAGGNKTSQWTITTALTVTAPPAPAITSPADGSTLDVSDPTIAWTYYSTNGSPQSAATLTFDPQDGTQPLVFSMSGPQTQYTLPRGSLQTGHSYLTSLDVWDSQGLSSVDNDTSTATYDIVYLPPAQPTLDLAFDPDSGTVALTVTSGDGLDGVYDGTDHLDIYRQELDGTWTLIASEAASGDTYADSLTPVGTTVDYQAAAVTADGMMAYSEILSVYIPVPPWFYFSYYDDTGLLHTLKAQGDLVLGRKPTFTSSTFQVAGRTLPVAMYSANVSEELDISATLNFAVQGGPGCNVSTFSSSDADFYDMAAASPIICFRGVNVDGSPVKAWGLMTSFSVQSSYPKNSSQGVGFAALSITLQRIDYNESVVTTA